MLRFKIDMVKAAFLDKVAITDKVQKAKLARLKRFGFYARRVMKNLIKNRAGSSSPGSPPHGHPRTGEKDGLLEQHIYFAYDRTTDEVILGPAGLNKIYFDGDGKPLSGPVPNVLDKGGTIQILQVFVRSQWRRADLRSRRRLAGLPTRLVQKTIQPRPFTAPTIQAAAPKMAQQFKDAIVA